MFEAAVPPVDLEKFPGGLSRQDSFCRATLTHSDIHVFAFSKVGGSPMTGFAAFPADQPGLPLK